MHHNKKGGMTRDEGKTKNVKLLNAFFQNYRRFKMPGLENPMKKASADWC